MSEKPTLKVNQKIFTSALTALRIYVRELEEYFMELEKTYGPDPELEAKREEVEILYQIVDGFELAADNTENKLLTSTKRVDESLH